MRRDLYRALATKIGQLILTGTGSHQPRGIDHVTGIKTATWPADSGGNTQFAYDPLCALEEALSDANALMEDGETDDQRNVDDFYWIVHPKIRRHARAKAELGTGTSRRFGGMARCWIIMPTSRRSVRPKWVTSPTGRNAY